MEAAAIHPDALFVIERAINPGDATNVVYCIVNHVNGRVYVGRTTRWPLRLKEHELALREGAHHNESLREDFANYGMAALHPYVVYTGEAEELAEQEGLWMERVAANSSSKLHNKHLTQITRLTRVIATISHAPDTFEMLFRHNQNTGTEMSEAIAQALREYFADKPTARQAMPDWAEAKLQEKLSKPKKP